ncbi:MAG: PucR family transcriptional regulator [Jatrophihabitantaceae bacterium]
MTLTVREALELPALRNAQARVLAGTAHLDRTVRWVHAAELSDIAALLNGGELLLTTGMGLRESVALRRRYIRQLADAGVAGLVVELGRNFHSMPAEMVRTAEEHGIVLIALERETRFVEVTEQIHRAIMSRQYELLSRVETLNRELTNLLLDGANIGQILHQLYETVGNPVVLENTAHQVVAYAPQDDATIAAVLRQWEEHSRTGHHELEPGTVHRTEACSPACSWVGIWLRHEPWGRIHVIESESGRDEITSLLLDRAGVAVGLSVLSQQDADHLSDRAASAVIADLLAGRYGSTKELLRRARNLGSDLSTSGAGGLVALVVEVTNLVTLATQHGFTEQDRQRIRLHLRTQLRNALTRHRCTGLLGLDGDRVLAVVAMPDRSRLPSVLEAVAATLRHAMAEDYPALSIVIGASRQSPPDALQRAFEQARVAVEFGHRSGTQELYQFDNIGIYPLLLRLAQGPELATFVESELGALLQHDVESGAKLLPTLQAYLANAGRKADTVTALQIQRRTLYARLSRLERLLGRSLDNQDTRTRLTLALQGHDILGGPGVAAIPRRR